AVVILENYNADGEKTSQGSGFFVSANGKLLTNYHVIRGATRLVARLPDQSTRDVEYISGYDVAADVAAVAISGGDLLPVKLGSSTALKVGDHLTALGAPLGFDSTLSEGIVSAIREFGTRRMIQTT